MYVFIHDIILLFIAIIIIRDLINDQINILRIVILIIKKLKMHNISTEKI